MARPEEELKEQPETDEPENGAGGNETEITPTAYEMELRETRWGLLGKVRNAEGLLGRLDVALENRHLRVYLYETEKGVHLVTQEKGQLVFQRTQVPDPVPEGGSMISKTRFVEVLEGSRQRYLRQIGEVEGMLDDLEKALKNQEVRVRCFRTDDGFGMETEEKGPLGFNHHRKD